METPKRALIYMLTNRVNGKRYIGFTSCGLLRRLRVHRSDARTGSHVLGRAIRKYGWDAFDVSILVESWDPKYTKDVLEPHFIREYETHVKLNKGYNMTDGGEGAIGYKKTPEQLARQSAALRGKKRILTPEGLASRKASLTPQFRLKISQAQMGHVCAESTKNDTRLTCARYLWTIRAPDGKTYVTFSLKAFSEAFGVAMTSLRNSLRRGRPSDRFKTMASYGWQAISKTELTEEMKSPLRQDPSRCWWEVST